MRAANHWHAGLLVIIAVSAIGLPGHASAETPETANPHGPSVKSCMECHSPNGWKPAVVGPDFDHSRNGPALTGAHATAACGACHRSLDFRVAKSQCVDCHQDVHQGEFGTDCGGCHGTRNFIERTDEMRRHRLTRFPLTGAHNAVDCRECHRGAGTGRMMYVSTPTNCEACHLESFTAAKNPDHVASGFPRDCSECHSATTWSTSRFNHDLIGFPLAGAHRTLDCVACHVGNRFAGTSPACVSCHQADYNGTTNPVHSTAGFPTDCAACHKTTAWIGTGFNHSTTAFPLQGAHLSVACASCHVNGQYVGLSTECVSCHQTDYNGTANPVHSAAGFPTTCATCHTTTSWLGATFNHGTTAFPLTGAHLGAACASCHVNGQYQGLSTACVSCHQSDYNGTSDPVHSAAGFPTTCASCHTTTAWLGARFDHDTSYFPIYSGGHSGRWHSCSDCHTNPSNYAVFTCFNCHPHSDKSGTDSTHSSVGGYSYNPTACYSCHPSGRA